MAMEQTQNNLVKQTARALGITQKELAERIGVSDGTVRNWSAGKDIPLWAINSMKLIVKCHEQKQIIDTLKHLQELLSNTH